jgi:hypothetical protein
MISKATVPLGQLASARSGDKGNHANIGVVAGNAEDFAILCQQLTATRVAEYFQGLGATRVERFELPEVWALNFVLYNALRGGASQSLYIDTQGKLLGTAILELELPALVEVESASGGKPDANPALWLRGTEDGTVD